MKRKLTALLLLAATFTLPAHAQAPFPSKPIRILVGFAAGGNTDIVSRTVAERM